MMTVPQSEFSRPISAAAIPAKGWELKTEATQAEREALVARMGLADMRLFSVEGLILPLSGGSRFRLDAHIHMVFEQICVVTLDPIEAVIDDDITVVFAPDDDGDLVAPGGKEIQLDSDAEDPPEAIVDGMIDAGEVLVQHAITLIDPFPRKDGAAIPVMPEGIEVALAADMAETAASAAEEGGETRKPFADLAALLGKKQ